jgi:hypothetical protein
MASPLKSESLAQQQPEFVAATARRPRGGGAEPEAALPRGGGEPEMASFRLLQSQGLINNGREMVQYHGPFECLAENCDAVIPNTKLVVRHWNQVHG